MGKAGKPRPTQWALGVFVFACSAMGECCEKPPSTHYVCEYTILPLVSCDHSVLCNRPCMQHLVASFGAPCWLPPLVWVEFAPSRQDGASRVPMVRVSVVVSYGTSKLLVEQQGTRFVLPLGTH